MEKKVLAWIFAADMRRRASGLVLRVLIWYVFNSRGETVRDLTKLLNRGRLVKG
jgi:hypothetical protein